MKKIRQCQMPDKTPPPRTTSASGGAGPNPASQTYGSLNVPGYNMEVQVRSPPRIVWYWVIKDKLDRLRDAIQAERQYRRSEFIVGGAGLALGTAEDTVQAFKALSAGQKISGWDLTFTALFIVSAGVVLWFWFFVKSKDSNVDKVLSEIEESKGEANVAAGPAES